MNSKKILFIFIIINFLLFNNNIFSKKDNNKDKRYDHYKVLQLKKNASDKQIKSAYRKLAKKYHPDKHTEDKKEKAEEKFIAVSKAYEVLSDPEKRKVYDQYGHEGIDMMEKGGDPSGGGNPFGGGGNPFGGGGGGFKFSTGGGGGGFDPFEMFANMFTGGGGGSGGGGPKFSFGGGGGGRRRPQRQQEIQYLYSDNTNIYEIRSKRQAKNLFGKTVRRENVWVVKFYSSNCNHCHKMKKQYDLLGEKMNGIVNVAAVNCDDDKLSSLCESYKVEGYPTILILSKDKAIDYEGKRTAKSISMAAIKKIPTNYVKIIKNKNENDIKQMYKNCEHKKNQCIILLTNKSESPPLFNSLATFFQIYKIDFFLIQLDPKTDINKNFFGLTLKKLPTIIFMDGNKIKISTEKKSISADLYNGELNYKSISSSIKKFRQTANKLKRRQKQEEKDNIKEDL